MRGADSLSRPAPARHFHETLASWAGRVVAEWLGRKVVCVDPDCPHYCGSGRGCVSHLVSDHEFLDEVLAEERSRP